MDNFNKNRLFMIKFVSIFLIMIIMSGFVLYAITQRENVAQGMLAIITSPTVLITDFFVVGGFGAVFLNAFLVLGLNILLLKILKIKTDGMVIACFFMVFGFSFFGKNILNIMPFYLGGIMYSMLEHIDFKEIFITICFSSALAPFVSEVAFRVGSDDSSSYLCAIGLGIIIGFVITPLAKHMFRFHEGFNLYNLGFTGGIVGAIVIAILKLYNFSITPTRLISTEYSTVLTIVCITLFLSLILVGFLVNDNSFSGYTKLLADSGLKVDFTKKYGFGLTFINMGVMGFVSLLFLKVVGETLNGPILAGIFAIVGFSAHGKHAKNTLPILIGVGVAGYLAKLETFTVALTALFGTSLAPIAGVYGTIWGLVAGCLHLAVAQSIGSMHGGLNLYNNGFSAGIVAGFLLPFMELAKHYRINQKMKYLKRKKALFKAFNEERKKMAKEKENESN